MSHAGAHGGSTKSTGNKQLFGLFVNDLWTAALIVAVTLVAALKVASLVVI